MFSFVLRFRKTGLLFWSQAQEVFAGAGRRRIGPETIGDLFFQHQRGSARCVPASWEPHSLRRHDDGQPGQWGAVSRPGWAAMTTKRRRERKTAACDAANPRTSRCLLVCVKVNKNMNEKLLPVCPAANTRTRAAPKLRLESADHRTRRKKSPLKNQVTNDVWWHHANRLANSVKKVILSLFSCVNVLKTQNETSRRG